MNNTNKIKIAVLGNSYAAELVIKKFIKYGFKVECIISLKKNLQPENSYFLKKFAKSIDIDFIEVANINSQKNIKLLIKYKLDIIYTIWPKILSKEVIELSKICTIGSHPTALPQNRGRHPVQWQITLLQKKSKLTYFFLDNKVDNGKIIFSLPYTISNYDDVNTVNNKIDKLHEKAAIKLSKLIIKNMKNLDKFSNLKSFKKQNTNNSNYWRKKNKHDVLIDFRMSAESIAALVRSYTTPYPCAFFVYKNSKILVNKVKIIKYKVKNISNLEPGYIIDVKKNYLKLKCADKVIILYVIKSDLSKIDFKKYIYPPSKYLSEYIGLIKKINY